MEMLENSTRHLDDFLLKSHLNVRRTQNVVWLFLLPFAAKFND